MNVLSIEIKVTSLFIFKRLSLEKQFKKKKRIILFNNQYGVRLKNQKFLYTPGPNTKILDALC